MCQTFIFSQNLVLQNERFFFGSKFFSKSPYSDFEKKKHSLSHGLKSNVSKNTVR